MKDCTMILLVALFAGCGDGAGPGASQPGNNADTPGNNGNGNNGSGNNGSGNNGNGNNGVVEVVEPDDWDAVSPEDRGTGSVDPVTLEQGRVARRMTVDQLRRSIPALFGGLTWTTASRNGDVSAFDSLGRTLGEADYIEVTAPNEDPNALFMKFMDDMAGQVCGKAVDQDVRTNRAEDRLVVRTPDDVDANLRFLRLKLHNLHVPGDSMEGLADYRQLHDDILADTGQSREAWVGVCVAMVTSPEFMAY